MKGLFVYEWRKQVLYLICENPFSLPAGNAEKWEKSVSFAFGTKKNLIALGSDLRFQEEVSALHHFTAPADQEWH